MDAKKSIKRTRRMGLTHATVYVLGFLLSLAVSVVSGADAVQPAVAWTDNLNGALARAQNEFKPLLVVFSSPDCPWCARFKRETLTEREVLTALSNFICVDIDTTRDPTAAQRHQIRGVPATLILSGDGRPQWGTEGFMDQAAFLKFIDVYRQGRGLPTETSSALDGWIKALREKTVQAEQWPDIMAGLGDKSCRSRLHPALLAYAPTPRWEWVELLAHPQLAVRLGAFELLEELAGSGQGYDPWSDTEANREALSRWQAWATEESIETGPIFAPLTEAQIHGYIRDLAADDRERSARAVRMLEQAGEGVIPALEAWLADGASADAVALRQVREVRYFLLLPESLGTERARLAHRLVFGNQDERLRGLAAAAVGGAHSLPVLIDFLADPDPFMREAAVDAVISADRNRASTYLLELLKTEREEAVMHAVVRGAGRLKATQALELAGPFLSHASEDLVVAALASLSRTKSTPTAKAIAACLRHPQWRVRAAALEALARLNVKRMDDEVDACLGDPDPFVRHTAVATLASLSAKKSVKRLSELFLKDDSLKAPVVAALRDMDVPLPDTFGPALQGKDVDVLLPVLDALGYGTSGFWRLALPYVHHENDDVACAAIRVAAKGGGGEAEVRTELAKVLRCGRSERLLAVFEVYPPRESQTYDFMVDPFDSMDFDALATEGGGASATGEAGEALTDIFAAFAAAEAAPVPVKAPPPVALTDLFAAFGTALRTVSPQVTAGSEASGEEVQDADILKETLAVLDTTSQPELRLAAACSLLAMGNERGADVLMASLDTYTTEERLKIVRRIGRCTGEQTTALIGRLLRDPSADVRRRAAAISLQGASDERLLRALLAEAFEPSALLVPPDLMQESYEWRRTLRRAPARRIIGEAARRALNEAEERRLSDAQRILALTLLDACWRSGDQRAVQNLLSAENPFVRRAAWLTLGRNRREDFLKQIDTVAQDASEWVRGAVPTVFLPQGPSVYFDATTVVDGLNTSDNFSSTTHRLPPAVVTVLMTLSQDPALMVRSAAAMCLLAYREKADIRLLTAMLDSAPDKMSVAYRLGSLLEDVPLNWLREQNSSEVLNLLDALLALANEEDDDNDLLKLRKRLVAASEGGTNAAVTVTLRQDEPRPAWSGAVRAFSAAPEDAVTTAAGVDGMARRPLVFFRSPGCRDCERVEAMLSVLAAERRDLAVEVRNIRNPQDARINEALCLRFNVPVDDHLTTPAIFCGAGVLLKREITFERLERLLSRPQAAASGWRQLSAIETAQAGQKIETIYAGLAPLLVFGAGLSDGVNPCAFATIIFLLSYLQLARRKPRELLAVGGAFVAGVFLAYVVLGLGLVELVERLSLLRRFARLFNWGLIAVVAVVAALNVWDGVLCLRGRMGDMILQLPEAFKQRIHGVVRHSARRRRFVLAAFLAGVAISLLELACTGQVYAPTLLYILKTTASRRGVFAYLVLYNVAFVVPLIIVFFGAYSGLRSERLTVWLRQRAAVVKFATAALFVAILVLLVGRFAL